MKAKTNNKKIGLYKPYSKKYFFKIIVGLILWSMFFSPQTVLAQRLDFSTHRGNPLVDVGQTKITFDFELNGVAKSIEILKSCSYYKGKEGVYGIWMSQNRYLDYISDEGWAIQLKLALDTQCANPDNRRTVVDWDRDFVLYGKMTVANEDGSETEYLNTRSVQVYYVDNFINPTIFEEHYSSNHSHYDVFSEIDKSNVLVARKITFSFVPAIENNDIKLGYIDSFGVLDDKIKKNKEFASFRGSVISKKDWKKNKDLKQILDKIQEPTILDPEKNPEYLPLYIRNQSMSSFPQKPNKFGLDAGYVFEGAYLGFIDKGLWDLRKLSFSERKIKDEKARKIYKIAAGSKVVDLMDLSFFRQSRYGGRVPLVWFYDPATGLLIAFFNNR